MSEPKLKLLKGVNTEYVRDRFKKSGGHEIASGKFSSRESSAALTANTFAWFHDRPALLPLFPGIVLSSSRILSVDIEHCARFPWRGGMHPWLDAWIETEDTIIGVESKRFEPFRKKKAASLSIAYDRKVWHDAMGKFERMRDRLRDGREHFEFLDAVQLVKHAFGLVTQGRKTGKRPWLVYLFAEPEEYQRRVISQAERDSHREEALRFAKAVRGAEVGFYPLSYRDWMSSWDKGNAELIAHRDAIIENFHP